MNRKKIIARVLAATIVLGNCSTAMAQSGIKTSPIQMKADQLVIGKDVDKEIKEMKKEDAIDIAKTFLKNEFKIDITDDYKMSANYDGGYGMGTLGHNWSIRFSLNKEDENTNIYVGVNTITGKIVSYNNYSYNDESKIANISYSEAQKIALEKMKKLFPEEMKEVRIPNISVSGNNYGGKYSIYFTRENQGILFDQNYVRCGIDSMTGEVVDFSISWDKTIEFPDIKKAIAPEKAKDIIIDEMKENLIYKEYRNKYKYQQDENKRNIKLVYDIVNPKGTRVDAIDGEFQWKSNGNTTKKIDLTETEKTELLKHYEKITNLAKELDQQSAEKMALEIVKRYYGEGFEIKDSNYSDQEYQENTIWSVNLEKKVLDNKVEDKKIEETTTVSVVLDAKTGKLEKLYENYYVYENGNYKYVNDEELEQKVSWEEGYKKAIEVLQNEFSYRLKNLEFEAEKYVYTNSKGVPTKESTLNYTFYRKENGVDFKGNSISITIDAYRGNIERIYENWYEDAEFVSPEKKLSADEIVKIVDGKYSTKLKFVYEDEKVKLVYDLVGDKNVYSFNDMDAFTGELLDYSGEKIIESAEKFLEEIKDSKYAKELEILAYSGLMDIRDFELNKEVTNKSFIKAVVDAYGYRRFNIARQELKSDNYNTMDKAVEDESIGNDYMLTDEDYLKMAKFYGLVDEDMTEADLSKKVSREQMAKALVNFTGYGDIAQIKGIYKVDATDSDKINKDDIGFLALSVGFEILNIENGYLNPDKEIDNEELFKSIYYAVKNKKFTGYYPGPVYRK